MRFFFIVGNKRSGTSLLVRLLNMHPNVFCTHESDLAYLKYRLVHSPLSKSSFVKHERFWHHRRDDGYGMQCSIDTVGHLIDQEDPVKAFIDSMKRLMLRGSKIQRSFPDKDFGQIKALGDKKPVQYADPEVRRWLDETFNPVYLHSVRHPREVVRSMRELKLAQWWKEPIDQVCDKWAEHERWALEIPESKRFTYRYEDLLRNPGKVMALVYVRLGVIPHSDIVEKVRNHVSPQPRRKQINVPYTDAMKEIMDIHGYEE